MGSNSLRRLEATATTMPPTPIAIAVVEQDDKFLIGVRPEGVALGGYWEFPGGKIAVGESPAAAARRECLEETGLEVEVGEPYPEVVHQYDHDKVQLHFFACRPIRPDREPLAPFRWVARTELGRYQFPAANGALIKYLLER